MRKGIGRYVLGLLIVGLGGAIGVSLVAEAREDTGGADSPVVWSEGRVRVEVLNTGGVTGMARAATQRLRDAGFDVVDYGNLPPYDPDRASEVIDRVGRTDIARAVAEALGIDNVQSDPDPNLYVDVSVLVGGEWSRPDEGTRQDQSEARARWWDPRYWIRD